MVHLFTVKNMYPSSPTCKSLAVCRISMNRNREEDEDEEETKHDMLTRGNHQSMARKTQQGRPENTWPSSSSVDHPSHVFPIRPCRSFLACTGCSSNFTTTHHLSCHGGSDETGLALYFFFTTTQQKYVLQLVLQPCLRFSSSPTAAVVQCAPRDVQVREKIDWN